MFWGRVSSLARIRYCRKSFKALPKGGEDWGVSCSNVIVSKVGTRVVSPQNLCMRTVTGRMGGGFRRGGGAGACGVPRGKWGAVASR